MTTEEGLCSKNSPSSENNWKHLIPIGWLQVQLIILDNLGLSSELLENVALGLPVLQASNGSKNTIAHVSNRIGIVVRIDKWFRGAWNKTRTSTVDHRTTLAVKIPS